jgi:hypothetical protein
MSDCLIQGCTIFTGHVTLANNYFYSRPNMFGSLLWKSLRHSSGAENFLSGF